MSNKTTNFQLDWINPETSEDWSKWLFPVSNDSKRAYCKICSRSFSLSNMGRQAIISHSTSSKHIAQKKEIASHDSIANFFKPGSSSSATPTPAVSDSLTVSCVLPTPTIGCSSQLSSRSSINPFIISEATTKAEILWALKCIWSHYSYRSCENIQELWSMMFTDSEIAKQLTLGKTKMAYIVSFGLAQYFTASLLKTIQICPFYVICFDEAFNRISQRCQMDLVIRYWDDLNGLVQTR